MVSFWCDIDEVYISFVPGLHMLSGFQKNMSNFEHIFDNVYLGTQLYFIRNLLL